MSSNTVSLNTRNSWLLSIDSWAVVVALLAALLSIDSWAVVVALLAALLIRFGVFTRVPW